MIDAIKLWFEDFKADFVLNFIDSDRWLSLVKGLWSTLQITFFALLIGIVIGIVVAAVRSTWDKNQEAMAKNKGVGYYVMKILNAVCHVYLTVIRGTPVVVQLMIFYFIIFATSRNGLMVAAIAFGINSGAYVAEIFRGGIESIPKGQYEASAALSMTKTQTFFHIILPQVVKRVVPASSNEVITLIKDTSLANVIAFAEITLKAKQQMQTYSSLTPLFIAGLFYFVLAMILTVISAAIEKKLDYYK